MSRTTTFVPSQLTPLAIHQYAERVASDPMDNGELGELVRFLHAVADSQAEYRAIILALGSAIRDTEPTISMMGDMAVNHCPFCGDALCLTRSQRCAAIQLAERTTRAIVGSYE